MAYMVLRMGAVKNDRIDRLIAWQEFVLTERGRNEFLQRLLLCGDVVDACREMDLPPSRVVAFLAEHAELDDAADRALKRYSHGLVAETLEIADASGDDKLRVGARFKVAGLYNKPMYGDVVKIDHQVTVGVSQALQVISERRRALARDMPMVDAGVVDARMVDVTPVRVDTMEDVL